MSEIIKRADEYNACSHFVKTEDGRHFYVDSRYTYDHGYETMVFGMAPKLLSMSCVRWSDLYMERYENVSDMAKKHMEICEHLEKYLRG